MVYFLCVDTSLSMGLENRATLAAQIIDQIVDRAFKEEHGQRHFHLVSFGEKIEDRDASDPFDRQRRSFKHIFSLASGCSNLGLLLSFLSLKFNPKRIDRILIFTDCATFEGDPTPRPPCPIRFVILNTKKEPMSDQQQKHLDSIAAASVGEESSSHHFFLADFEKVESLVEAVVAEFIASTTCQLALGNMTTFVKVPLTFADTRVTAIEIFAFCKPTNLLNMEAESSHFIHAAFKEENMEEEEGGKWITTTQKGHKNTKKSNWMPKLNETTKEEKGGVKRKNSKEESEESEEEAKESKGKKVKKEKRLAQDVYLEEIREREAVWGTGRATGRPTAPLLLQLLATGLKTQECVALGVTNTRRHVVVSTEENEGGLGCVVISLLPPQANLPKFIPDLSQIRTDFMEKVEKAEVADLHVKDGFPKPSYSQSHSTWITDDDLELEIGRIRKTMKKLPDGAGRFYTDINRVRSHAVHTACVEILGHFADAILEEAEAMGEVALKHAQYIAEHYKKTTKEMRQVKDIPPPVFH